MNKGSPAVKVVITLAQNAKAKLHALDTLQPGLKLEAVDGFFYLPVKPAFKKDAKLGFPYVYCTHQFQAFEAGRAKPLKELLASALSPKQVSLLHSSYDVVGDIAVISLPPELESKAGLVGKAILESNPRIKVVAQKQVTKGEFRVRRVNVIAGEKRTWTTHRENGCSFKLDLNKAYFSTRLNSERKRIAQLVKPNENVLVVFAGVGPFAIEIARKLKLEGKKCKVIAIEWNPFAAKLLAVNAKANKVNDLVTVLQEDATVALAREELRRKAHRVVMPLLHLSIDFVPLALKACRKGGMVHAYGTVSTKTPSALKLKQKELLAICKAQGRKCRVENARYCGTYSPRVDQAVFDLRVLD